MTQLYKRLHKMQGFVDLIFLPSIFPPATAARHRTKAERPGVALTSLLRGVTAPAYSRNHRAPGLSTPPVPPPCSPCPSCEIHLSQSGLAKACFPKFRVCLCAPCVPLRPNRLLFCSICDQRPISGSPQVGRAVRPGTRGHCPRLQRFSPECVARTGEAKNSVLPALRPSPQSMPTRRFGHTLRCVTQLFHDAHFFGVRKLGKCLTPLAFAFEKCLGKSCHDGFKYVVSNRVHASNKWCLVRMSVSWVVSSLPDSTKASKRV